MFLNFKFIFYLLVTEGQQEVYRRSHGNERPRTQEGNWIFIFIKLKNSF